MAIRSIRATAIGSCGSITKPIVYYDPQIDITPDVLRMLNGAAVAGAAATQPKPVR